VKRTSKEPNVHQFILGYWGAHGYGPSYREIADGTELRSLNAVKLHVTALIKKGALTREHRRARTIRPVQPKEVAT
jgi:repressor LexA